MSIIDAQMQHCRFFVLRYVPDAVKNEFVNIGVVLLPPKGQPELRFTRDWSRVQALDPQADTELLEAFRDELTGHGGEEWLLRRIEDSFSNVFQASESRACLTSSPSQEADELARMYLDAPRRPTARAKSARQAILQSMQKEFQREGVWRSMRTNIAVSQYTRSADPLEIDCGYSAKSLVRMFHATALKTDVNAAKVLAFSYPELVEGIRKAEGAQAHLTAIVEDGLEKQAQVGFALDTLERCGIQIAAVSDLPSLARTAAREMGIQ
ncbi:MAG TPA: DUF3037 domain-containing protein [Candidatus Angelobacter sp.]